VTTYATSDILGRTNWLFDLDGTLIDSSTAVVRAFHVAQTHFGEPPADAEMIRARIGYPLRETVANLTDIEFDPFLVAFRQEAMRTMHLDTVFLLGVADLLATLKALGRVCAVVTSKGRANAKFLLEHLGVAGSFATVVGEDCTPFTKPHPAPIHEAIVRLGASTDTVVMIGDTRNDIEAARQAGVPVIALCSGYDKPELLSDADLVLVDAAELNRRLLGEDGSRPR
jgi:phosphoglycolate phosphatase